jgi:hypothetical protein
MNRIILVSIFCLTFTITEAQNILSISYAPSDNAPGLRFDRKIKNFGIYAASSKGNYTISETASVKDHVKFTAGFVKYCQNKTNQHFFNTFSLGISYHKYGKYQYLFDVVKDKTFNRISMEIGTGACINKFNAGFTYDPFKKECMFYGGFRLPL